MAGLDVPFTDAEVADSACHLMTVVAPDAGVRHALARALRRRGVQTSLHYPCITGFTAFAGSQAAPPRGADYAGRTLTLPLFPTLAVETVGRICDEVEAALHAARSSDPVGAGEAGAA